VSAQPANETDVLVIGAGASGAALTWRLAQAGVRVICLEQGDWVAPEQIPTTRADWEIARQTVWSPNPNIRRLAQDYPVRDDETPIKPQMFNGVGGSTIMWSCFCPRFHPHDFKVRSTDGVAADWPLSYDELAPYYDLNDRMMGMSGLAGDPSVPARTPRPMPPLPIGAAGRTLACAFDKLGWHWWPADMARNSVEYRGRGACNNCGACEAGCVNGAKATVDITYWPAAIKYGAELRTGARVFEITTGTNGRATGALYYDRRGSVISVRASAVVVAANGIGTPRLLLLSRSPRFPDGLANSSGFVGRNLMFHPIAAVTGVFDRPLDEDQGGAASILSNEFYGTRRGHDFVRGYMLAGPRTQAPLATALGAFGRRMPWGARHHEQFERLFGHSGLLVICGEDLPRESNCVLLDSELKDSDGIAAPRLVYELDENSRNMIRHGMARSKEIWYAAGASETIEIPLLAQTGFHLMGTARMGEDPQRSVVDRYGRSHDVDNLFIVDGSVFVTAAAVNPTPTIQALALRTADHMLATRH
jgi:choline dehydrogenase-like flavoprotein